MHWFSLPVALLFAAVPAWSNGTDKDYLDYVKGQVEIFYKGVFKTPIPSGPAVAGKNVWIISPGQVGESGSIPCNAVKEAGEAVGWKMTLFDSKEDPTNFATGVRQAVAAKADGIILFAIDCAWVRQALFEARMAKVKTVAFSALDCDDPSVKGQPLFDRIGAPTGFTDYAASARAWGATKAHWLIQQTQGQAKVIEFKDDELLVLKYIREGFDNEIKKCAGCQIVKTVDMTLADFGPKLQQKAHAAFLQFPEANSVHVLYDTLMFQGIQTALAESGRMGQLLVVGGEGFPSNLKLIKDKKGQDAAAGFPSVWYGWGAVDLMNSVFRGDKQMPDSGLSWQLIDREHNLPADGVYKGPVDFKTIYRRAWGVQK